MREHKYRGRRIDNGEWVYGSLVDNLFFNRHTKVAITYIVNPDEYDYDSFDDLEHLMIEVDPETVGQYTGRNDRNGMEVFKADIVDYWRTNYDRKWGIVKFGEYDQDGSGGEYGPTRCYGFYVETVKLFPTPLDIEPYEREEDKTVSLAEFEFEVIGNAHDHPHLLGASK